MIVLPAPGSSARTNRKRLARQHRLVDGRDLVRQRLHVRGVDRHHRVEQKREVDALGLAGQLERRAVAVEGPRAFDRGDVMLASSARPSSRSLIVPSGVR